VLSRVARVGGARASTAEEVVAVAVYEFRCREHGAWEELRPLGRAPDDLPCPECGAPARRVITAPRLSRASQGRMRVIEATEASADAPPVVTALPSAPRRRPRAATNPALQRLPRP